MVFDPVGLWLEGVGIEGGHVVGDVQIVQPIETAHHEGGPKADGIPFFEVVIDQRRIAPQSPYATGRAFRRDGGRGPRPQSRARSQSRSSFGTL